MKKGTFYLLPVQNKNQTTSNYIENFICQITKDQWRLGKSIFIACENKQQAIKIDKDLWECDQNCFLPHNIIKNNKYNNSPIILYWPEQSYNNNPKDLLINLIYKNIDFFIDFKYIIDFVPDEPILKKWARIRYKAYKNAGFQLKIINILNTKNR